MAQTREQKKNWVRANPVVGGLTPAQYRMLYCLLRLRYRDGVQAWHGEAQLAALWRAVGGSPTAPLLASLWALHGRGYADRSVLFEGHWRLRTLPDSVMSGGAPAEEQLLALAQPRTVRAVA